MVKKSKVNRTNTEVIQNLSGLPDREYVKMKYSTTSAFTVTGGNASYLQVKLNSPYRPWPGNTDSAGGYSRMYSNYKLGVCHGSEIRLRLWSGSASSSYPFRVITIPCTSDQYTVYSGYTNIVALNDVPHAKSRLFSPGSDMINLSSYSSVQTLAFGNNKQNDLRLRSSFSAQSGSSPGDLFYWLVALQVIAGTTTVDCQLEAEIIYYMEYYQPVVSTIPQLIGGTTNDISTSEEKKAHPISLQHPPTVQATSEPEYELVRVPLSRSKK